MYYNQACSSMTTLLPQKPHLLKIIPPVENSIVVKDDIIAWNNPWHFHPEVELLHCIKGRGTNFIGNKIFSIEEGELLLLGKNLPHTRQRDKEYYLQNPNECPQSIVIQFKEDFVGDKFFSLKEFIHLPELLKRARRGLKFKGNTLTSVTKRLYDIQHASDTEKILILIAVLDQLARSDEFEYLNPAQYANDAHEKSAEKINKVYHYTIEHFREHISLQHVADLTHHSPAAFCRYFKARTRKSFFQYLTEVRIGYACKLLMEGTLDVTQVCFSSGFNNLSNFHKQFKKVMKMTPKEYKAQGLKKIPGGLS
jgi:AraC-like DNA-binding protein